MWREGIAIVEERASREEIAVATRAEGGRSNEPWAACSSSDRAGPLDHSKHPPGPGRRPSSDRRRGTAEAKSDRRGVAPLDAEPAPQGGTDGGGGRPGGNL